MEIHQNASPASRQVRAQKFLNFKLRPEDEALLHLLPDNQRALLLARGSYKELSERFGLPIGTVRSRIHRARVALERLREGGTPAGPESANCFS